MPFPEKGTDGSRPVDDKTLIAALTHDVPRIPDIVQDDHLPLKHRVPLVSDADVVTDDFAAERCRRFCRVQRLVTVKGDGQVGTDGTFGYLAGVVWASPLAASPILRMASSMLSEFFSICLRIFRISSVAPTALFLILLKSLSG